MAVNVKAEVTQERINAMVNAGKAGGATSFETPPTGIAHVDDLQTAPAMEADEPTDAGQPAEKPDPVAETKAQYEARVKELEEELKNQKAMQSGSHKRNAEAARDRQLAEERERKAEERELRVDTALRRMDGMTTGLVQLAKLNPDVAAQVLQTWGQDAGSQAGIDRQFAIGSPQPTPQVDPRVAQLEAKLAQFEQQVSGYAFEVNAGAVNATIERMVVANPAFELAEKLGEMDDIRERVWTNFVKADKENPGAVSPHNPRQINDAVKKLVEAEAKRWKKINDETIKNYREKRKTLNAQAGAPTRGPSATVRAAPTPTGPNPHESPKAKQDRWVRQMAEVTKAARNGGTAASEI